MLTALLLTIIPTRLVHAQTPDATVEQWGVYEIVLAGVEVPDPYLSVPWCATFLSGDREITVPGFWDGGNTFRVRFSPPTTGAWRYETRSATPALNGRSDAFTATASTGNNHGPVEIFDSFYLRFADGQFDFSRPNPEFWRHFEQRILDLQALGIEADLILWHPYDRWGFADMTDAQDDRYLRYCIARLGAFRNVWWSLANEYDCMTDRPPGHRGNKQWADWDRFFAILQAEDSHQRLRGIHNGRQWYDHTREWVTHASLQSSDMNSKARALTSST